MNEEPPEALVYLCSANCPQGYRLPSTNYVPPRWLALIAQVYIKIPSWSNFVNVVTDRMAKKNETRALMFYA